MLKHYLLWGHEIGGTCLKIELLCLYSLYGLGDAEVSELSLQRYVSSHEIIGVSVVLL